MEDLEFDANFIIPFRNRSNTWPTNGPEENSSSDYNRTLETCEEISSSSSFKTLIPSTTDDILLEQDENSDHQDDLSPQSQIKKNSSRRNAWGNHSYADLITQAIQQSSEKRLTLSQIYEWMVQNVDYFKDKGDSNSSAGWKNSIRHNLSLHNRFMRVQNDGAGKSSWWMINPEAKPGKGARRRASSMETKAYEKKKGRAKKKAELARQSMLAASSLPGPNSLIDHTPSPCSSISENIDAFSESPVLSTGQLTSSHVQVHQNQHHQNHPHQHNQNNSPVYHTLNSAVLQQKTAQNSIYSNSNGSNCLLAQLNSPDHSFRKRTASNASSCGRLSPLDENLPSTLSPLKWNSNNASVYGQPEMETYTDQLIDITHSLSIGGSNNNGDISIIQNPNLGNSQLSTSYPNNSSYLSNNMFMSNNFMNEDSMINRGSCNKNLSTSNLSNINNGNRCLISRLNPSKMITSNLCKPNNTNSISNRNENMLSCDNTLTGSISEGSLLNSINDCFNSNNLIGNSENQSIDSYFNNQADYQLGGQQMINNNLNCDNNNQNDDENNNRIFSLTNLSSNSVPNSQIGIQNNYNLVRCEQQNNATYNIINERMYNQNSNMVYQNNLNSFSNGQQNCYNPLPNDLDPNLYSQNSALDCDIESVIKKELSFDGSLDFNFDSIPHTSVTTPSNNKTISNPTAATQSWVH